MKISVTSLLLVLTLAVIAGCNDAGSAASGDANAESVKLLNVSYDPTRELWRAINAKFIPEYSQANKVNLEIEQSHAGSSSQARAVIDGLDADVVTLALWTDTDNIRAKGLIESGWEDRFENRSLPYISTIVFVVRKGNPKGIKDWPDLIREGVEVITPSPKTSGNGKLSFLAAWGSVTLNGGSEEDARAFVTSLYQHTPILDAAARAATTTFAQKKIGDVHLTWENEAHLEVKEANGALEIVYPTLSIRAEPHVAVVDANVKRKGPSAEAAAKAYLEYLYTEAAQDIIAENHYRPTTEAAVKKFADRFPEMRLFSITEISAGWEESNQTFFAEGGVFDSIYDQQNKEE